MIAPSKISSGDWIAFYAAVLATITAVVAGIRWVVQWIRERKERNKFQTNLYFLRKIDRITKQIHPIVVVLLANLSTARISLKSLEYEGMAENGVKTSGSMGWYEQPEELYGIRNRLLPIVLESGQTADLPMIEIGILTRARDLKVWLTDFNERRYYISDNDIKNANYEIGLFLGQKNSDEKTIEANVR